MSILGESNNFILLFWAIVALLLLLLSAGLALMLRIYRPAFVVGPERLGPEQQSWHVAVALLVGFVAWIGLQIAYITAKQAAAMKAGSMNAGEAYHVGEADYAFLSTVPFAVGFAILLGVNLALGGSALVSRLGMALRGLPAGVRQGLIASVIIVPPTFAANYLSEIIMHALHITHPQEHELLKAMGESHNLLIRAALILGATIGAPLFEEFLFRGHVQTLLRKSLIAMGAIVKPPIPPGLAMIQPLPLPQSPGEFVAPIAQVVQYPAPANLAAANEKPDSSRVWQTWAAILLASLLFAVVHPLWMAPPIFVLALGLGYAYERTGNLWASMTVHCVFNSISTVLFFLQGRPG